MDREQKAALVEEMTASLSDAEAIFAVDYRGISVPQAAELRTRLAEADATFRIVKNRLAKLAAENAGTDGLVELFEGPTALTFVKGDPVTAAKAIATFGREHDVLDFKGGLMEGDVLDPDQFKVIARLPGLDVLRGQLVGVAASPITGLARGPRRDALRARDRPRPDPGAGPGRRRRAGAGARGGGGCRARRRGGRERRSRAEPTRRRRRSGRGQRPARSPSARGGARGRGRNRD